MNKLLGILLSISFLSGVAQAKSICDSSQNEDQVICEIVKTIRQKIGSVPVHTSKDGLDLQDGLNFAGLGHVRRYDSMFAVIGEPNFDIKCFESMFSTTSCRAVAVITTNPEDGVIFAFDFLIAVDRDHAPISYRIVADQSHSWHN